MSNEVMDGLQAFVGRPYVPEVYDCSHLARDVRHALFGLGLNVPEVNPGGAAGQRRVINALRDELAVQISAPQPGCVALLSEPTAAGDLLHIGTVGMSLGEVWVLHNSAKLGSAHLQRLTALQRYGMRLEGYYAWK